MAELNELQATYSVAINDLRKASMKVTDAAVDSAVTVLNHNSGVSADAKNDGRIIKHGGRQTRRATCG